MQYELQLEGASRLQKIHRRLLAAYGPPPATFRLDPVSQLVLSMLGARTRDAVSRNAFAALANRHPFWEELISLPHRDIFVLISDVTFAERKAEFIPLALLAIVERRGTLDLDFLGAWSVDAAFEWLDALPGVGPKTAAAVLNFSTLHQRALVVDTHYWRAAYRLQLIPYGTNLTRASQLLTRQLPYSWTADDTEKHFLLMKRLGQEYCRHFAPLCSSCPLRPVCPQARKLDLHRVVARKEIQLSIPSSAHGQLA